MSDFLLHLAAANLMAAAAVVLVLALRLPARRVFGARIAYGLWALVPLAAVAMLLPARVVTVEVEAQPAAAGAAGAAMAAAPLPAGPALLDPWMLAAGLWIAGALASLAWLAWRQAAFARAARDGLAGPAVIGVLKPRIVTPSDFSRRYTPREQAVVLAHEAAHIARQDPRINALVAVARCLNWFNPLAHALAHYLRIDQELACDAAVVAAHPRARRSYAEAMLKTQLAHRPPPLGCAWPAASIHPLAERVSLLARPMPDRAQRRLGAAVVVLLGLATVGSAWASKPARVLLVERATPPAHAPAPRAPTPEPPAPAAPRGLPAPTARSPAPFLEPAAPASDPTLAAAEAQADTQAAPALTPESETRPYTEARRNGKVFMAAERSRVEPGSAVRLVATATDPDGLPLMADLTAFGSQRYYRTGSYRRSGSRYALFTSVEQQGDRLLVTASLNRGFQAPAVGSTTLRSGETGEIQLGSGQVVTVTPTIRSETPEEIAGGRAALAHVAAEAQERGGRAWASLKEGGEAWARYRERCRGQTTC